jgi:polyphosphate kinase 2 (PPK2 family)
VVGEQRAVALGQPQAVELFLDGAWRRAEMLGWRHDGEERCRARVRLGSGTARRVVWAPLTLLRLPEPEPPSEPQPGTGTAPTAVDPPVVPVPRAALPPVPAAPVPTAPALPGPHRTAAAAGRLPSGQAGAGTAVPCRRPETWREDRPHPAPLRRREYELDLRRLQIELLKLHREVVERGRRVVVVVEGRAAAGVSGTIRRFAEHLDPRRVRVVADGCTERGGHLPAAGEIVLFDRSWCGDGAALPELRAAEQALVDGGTSLVKLWLSVSRGEQRTRLGMRRPDGQPTPDDLAVLDRWDDVTAAREALFAATSTAAAPWTVILADDRRRARLEAVRHVLSVLGAGDAAGRPDPRIVVPVTGTAPAPAEVPAGG